jgi:hypothetical protein
LVAGNREFINLDDDTVLAAARSDPTGLVRTSTELRLTKCSECRTCSGPSRSRWMTIAAPFVIALCLPLLLRLFRCT